ncbi:MAG: formylglycine-generating enzyme family protein [Treponema sp.]|jgi:formylglycine-generating enzyme required for sulfatase activity|nr:formylglycine-generating enzyme family protein [Treponema sp.]
MAFTKDTLLTGVLAASGAKQTVKYDDKGNPSIMTRIPRFNLEDIDASLGSGPHPVFIVNGEVKSEILIGTYPAVIDGGRACCIPGQTPAVSISFDNAKAACVAKGPGWHLMTAWEWGAVALWCLKNGFQPRGNTNYGKSHEAPWETATLAPDNAKTLAGAGPASWRHDNTYQGIADLAGNVWEWNDGIKLVNGRFYFPLDNNFNLAEGSWPASPLYMDASAGARRPQRRGGERDAYSVRPNY